MINMTSTIFWTDKQDACEFVKNVSSEDIKGNLRIYASRNDRRVFLVDDFKVLASEVVESYEIDALLDEEDANYIFTTLNVCCDFGQELNTIIRND